MPKREVDELFELPAEDYQSLMAFSQRVAKSLKRIVPCKRIGALVLGMEVPHAHLHLVPINAEHELSFANAQAGVPQEEMIALAQAISSDLDSAE